MSYTSQFTGAQMDAVFRRVTNMVTGRATLTSTTTGIASLFVDVDVDIIDPICIATVRYNEGEYPMNTPISVFVRYQPNEGQGKLAIKLVGDAVRAGRSYDVDYLLME